MNINKSDLANPNIPKTIHIIWVGDESKRPSSLIKTWKDKNPTWAVKVWGNKELKRTDWYNQKHINERFNAKEYTTVADMMRYEILFNHGGFFVDADTACTAPLQPWLFDSQVCMSMENEVASPFLIANCFIAAEPKSALMAELMMSIKGLDRLDTDLPWIVTGPRLLTDTVNRLKYNNLTLWPSHYFIPDHWTGEKYLGRGHIFAKHIWGTTKGISDKLVEVKVVDSSKQPA
ncbi:glycosyltransferase family 32 protein [Providencia sp. NPDC089923]|uniref:glycosyltransferase family 32 protein n=1 Tax=Providencia sp. NPDC089923 TaxID=3415004 RepID=UPI003C2D1B6D